MKDTDVTASSELTGTGKTAYAGSMATESDEIVTSLDIAEVSDTEERERLEQAARAARNASSVVELVRVIAEMMKGEKSDSRKTDDEKAKQEKARDAVVKTATRRAREQAPDKEGKNEVDEQITALKSLPDKSITLVSTDSLRDPVQQKHLKEEWKSFVSQQDLGKQQHYDIDLLVSIGAKPVWTKPDMAQATEDTVLKTEPTKKSVSEIDEEVRKNEEQEAIQEIEEKIDAAEATMVEPAEDLLVVDEAKLVVPVADKKVEKPKADEDYVITTEPAIITPEQLTKSADEEITPIPPTETVSEKKDALTYLVEQMRQEQQELKELAKQSGEEIKQVTSGEDNGGVSEDSLKNISVLAKKEAVVVDQIQAELQAAERQGEDAGVSEPIPVEVESISNIQEPSDKELKGITGAISRAQEAARKDKALAKIVDENARILDDNKRIAKAEADFRVRGWLGKDEHFDEEQRDALIAAHNIGLGAAGMRDEEGAASVFNYKLEQLVPKMKELQRKRKSKDEEEPEGKEEIVSDVSDEEAEVVDQIQEELQAAEKDDEEMSAVTIEGESDEVKKGDSKKIFNSEQARYLIKMGYAGVRMPGVEDLDIPGPEEAIERWSQDAARIWQQKEQLNISRYNARIASGEAPDTKEHPPIPETLTQLCENIMRMEPAKYATRKFAIEEEKVGRTLRGLNGERITRDGSTPMFDENDRIIPASFLKWEANTILARHGDAPADPNVNFFGEVAVQYNSPYGHNAIPIGQIMRSDAYFREEKTGEIHKDLWGEMVNYGWLISSIRQMRIYFENGFIDDAKFAEIMVQLMAPNNFSKLAVGNKQTLEYLMTMPADYQKGPQQEMKFGDVINESFWIFYHMADYEQLNKDYGDTGLFNGNTFRTALEKAVDADQNLQLAVPENVYKERLEAYRNGQILINGRTFNQEVENQWNARYELLKEHYPDLVLRDDEGNEPALTAYIDGMERDYRRKGDQRGLDSVRSYVRDNLEGLRRTVERKTREKIEQEKEAIRKQLLDGRKNELTKTYRMNRYLQDAQLIHGGETWRDLMNRWYTNDGNEVWGRLKNNSIYGKDGFMEFFNQFNETRKNISQMNLIKQMLRTFTASPDLADMTDESDADLVGLGVQIAEWMAFPFGAFAKNDIRINGDNPQTKRIYPRFFKDKMATAERASNRGSQYTHNLLEGGSDFMTAMPTAYGKTLYEVFKHRHEKVIESARMRKQIREQPTINLEGARQVVGQVLVDENIIDKPEKPEDLIGIDAMLNYARKNDKVKLALARYLHLVDEFADREPRYHPRFEAIINPDPDIFNKQQVSEEIRLRYDDTRQYGKQNITANEKILQDSMNPAEINLGEFAHHNLYGKVWYDHAKMATEVQQGLIHPARYSWYSWPIPMGAEERRMIDNSNAANGKAVFENVTQAEKIFGKQVLLLTQEMWKHDHKVHTDHNLHLLQRVQFIETEGPRKGEVRRVFNHETGEWVIPPEVQAVLNDRQFNVVATRAYLLARFSGMLYAHTTKNNTYKYLPVHARETIIHTLANIPAEMDTDEFNFQKNKVRENFFSEHEIKMLRKMSNNTFWRSLGREVRTEVSIGLFEGFFKGLRALIKGASHVS